MDQHRRAVRHNSQCHHVHCPGCDREVWQLAETRFSELATRHKVRRGASIVAATTAVTDATRRRRRKCGRY